MEVTISQDALTVVTTLTATQATPVPVSFGYHPYLTLSDAPRGAWRLALPERRHIALDAKGIPTGASFDERSEDMALGSRTFDDLFGLGTDREFVLSGPGRRITATFDEGYPYMQLYAPPRRRFLCIEPMTAPTNALCSGGYTVVAPGERYRAAFRLGLDECG
jgi:galactose mutarotase-like enzyme